MLKLVISLQEFRWSSWLVAAMRVGNAPSSRAGAASLDACVTIVRGREEFRRRIKTQTVLPSADTEAIPFWALLAFGQINRRKVDGLQTLATKPINQPIDLAA
jgi:hypothetical protein